MKIWKISYSISKDDILAARLSKEIFSIIKGNIGNNVFREIKADDKCLVFIYTNNSANSFLRYGTFDVMANFNFSKDERFDPSIRVDITLSNKFSRLYFDKIYYEIFHAIKHELGHYYQYNNSRNEIVESTNGNDNDYIDILASCKKFETYILSDLELIPYVKGLVFASKKSKIPFKIFLNSNLNGIFFHNDDRLKTKIMDSKEWSEINKIISNIKTIVMSKAMELYPSVNGSLGEKI